MANRKWKIDRDTGKLVEIFTAEQLRKKSAHVLEDTIDPVVSHATDEGLVFDSRSKLNAHYKLNGYECTGGDHLTGSSVTNHKHKADGAAIRATVSEELRKQKWGMAPMTEKEKERCLREERTYQQYRKNR